MHNLCLIDLLYQSDCVSRHCDTASLEHSTNETFVVSVQVWHLWVMTFMYCLYSKYISIIAASSYCYLLLCILVVGHNLLPHHLSFMTHISLSCFTFVPTVCLFLHDFYLAIHSGGGSHYYYYYYYYYYYCCYICKILSSDFMEQKPSAEVNKLLKFWLIHLLAFLQG